MVTLLLRLLRLLPLLCGAHRHVAQENLALRHQLAVYKRTVTRPKVRRSDRLFWVALSRVWAGWRQALVIVSPNHEVLTAPHSPWQNPFAERLIGFDPARVSESRSGSRRTSPAPHPGPLLLLLSPGSHASRARQGCAGPQARRAPRGGQDRGDSRSRWPASPLPPPGGVVQHRLSSLPSNTRPRSSSAAQPTCSRPPSQLRCDRARPTASRCRSPYLQPGSGSWPVDGLTDLGAPDRVG